jgi:hypothetical protein
MSELEYYADEITDADLDGQADAGEYCLEQSGFFLMPTHGEMQKLAETGKILLFLDRFRLFRRPTRGLRSLKP